MSSSMDTSQSPVAIPAPASPSSKSHNEPARLCGSCREAHETLLCDDGPDRETRSPNLPGDEWPDLPRLSKSAKEGCEFCGILQQAILSKRFIDTCEHLSKGSSACSSKKTLDLDIHYENTTTSVLSWPSYGGTQDMFLIVKATFNGGSVINMHFEIEADPNSPDVAKCLGLKAPLIHDYNHKTITSFLMGQLSKVPPSVNNYDCVGSFLPERLIEVGPSSLRIVEQASIRASLVKQLEYCALSYCWGPSEDTKFQAKITTTNLNRNL